MIKYINHSGGAEGADIEWETTGSKYVDMENKHYYHGYATKYGNIKLNDNEIEEGWAKILEANKKLKRNPYRYKSLLARNWYQVKNADKIFAISYLKNSSEVEGGTGWAVQMAIDCKKPIYVYDQNTSKWFEYCYKSNSFIVCDTPILSINFAGIGARKLLQNGKDAIDQVFKNTLLNNIS